MEVNEGRQQRKKHEQQHIDPQQVVSTLDGSIPGEVRDCLCWLHRASVRKVDGFALDFFNFLGAMA
jgi:hypothetical protein